MVRGRGRVRVRVRVSMAQPPGSSTRLAQQRHVHVGAPHVPMHVHVHAPGIAAQQRHGGVLVMGVITRERT